MITFLNEVNSHKSKNIFYHTKKLTLKNIKISKILTFTLKIILFYLLITRFFVPLQPQKQA